MATEREKEGSYYRESFGNAGSLGLISHIKQLVEREYLEEKEYLTFDELFFRLKRWWCKHYKRPYKDPLLECYTFEELFYEYWDLTYTPPIKDEEASNPGEIPSSEYDWAAEEEAQELEKLAELKEAQPKPESDNIVKETEDPSNEEWANKYINDGQALVNPSPNEVDEGGDISANFEV